MSWFTIVPRKGKMKKRAYKKLLSKKQVKDWILATRKAIDKTAKELFDEQHTGAWIEDE
jgi:hypothetical protein